jgi:hypothetical protein
MDYHLYFMVNAKSEKEERIENTIKLVEYQQHRLPSTR